MRKLIVSNFATLDGYYEGKDKSINSLFDYYHEDYSADDAFDHYNAERMRAVDFLLLSRNAFLGNKDYWTDVIHYSWYTCHLQVCKYRIIKLEVQGVYFLGIFCLCRHVPCGRKWRKLEIWKN